MRLLSLILLTGLAGITTAQEPYPILSQDALFPLPGKKAPKPKDLSATVKGYATPDSIIFEIQVTDDKLFPDTDPNSGDRVEIWFGHPETDFSDFLVAEKNGKSWIFRNSAEPGDNADLKRFTEHADYPTNGKVLDPGTQDWVPAEVPLPGELRAERVFYGLTRFGFYPDGRPPVQLDRDKYRHIENFLGYQLDDLSNQARYTVNTIKGGYSMRIALNNRCLGFATAFTMRDIRFVVDIADVDKKDEPASFLSTSSNRYYGRPFYFNKASLPFALNISTGIAESLTRKMGLSFPVVFAGGQWKTYFYSNGPIIYAHNVSSDAGLVAYEFYPATLTYESTGRDAAVPCERLDVEYDDIGIFLQREIYLNIEDSVLMTSKGFRYIYPEPGDFVNSVFRLKDGSPAAVLYDFEAVDPLGWGKYGHTADEYIYIQKLNAKGGTPLFSVGQRIEATGKVTVGDPKIVVLENVKGISYRWIRFGEAFEMKVDSDYPDYRQTLRFEIGADNKVRMMK